MQQERVDSSAIVVRPALTTEQLADLYMVRKDYREAAQTYKRLTDENPRNAVYLNKLGIALHQQEALTAGAEVLRAGHEGRSYLRGCVKTILGRCGTNARNTGKPSSRTKKL